MAISPTVTNSVTLMVLLPSSIALAHHQILTVRISFVSSVFSSFRFPYLEVFLKFHEFGFFTSSVGSFVTIVGLFPRIQVLNFYSH
jgi:hypothetical protein